jgi:hypothetical protein
MSNPELRGNPSLVIPRFWHSQSRPLRREANNRTTGAHVLLIRALSPKAQSGLISTLRNLTTPLSFATPLSSLLPRPC